MLHQGTNLQTETWILVPLAKNTVILFIKPVKYSIINSQFNEKFETVSMKIKQNIGIFRIRIIDLFTQINE